MIERLRGAVLAPVALAATLLACNAAGAATVQVLQDPGLDARTGGTAVNPFWTTSVNEPGLLGLSGPYEGFGDAPGNGLGFWFRAFAGEGSAQIAEKPANASIAQSAAAMAGGPYTLSFATKVETNFVANTLTMAVSFLDAADSILSTSLFNILSIHPGDASWQSYSLIATAPAGTANVKVEAAMTGGRFVADPRAERIHRRHWPDLSGAGRRGAAAGAGVAADLRPHAAGTRPGRASTPPV